MITPTNQYDSEGRPHGVWEDYLEDGTLSWREYYRHGKPYGASELYHHADTPYLKRYFLAIK
jgi:antitoxin component YwqK of YwqJK toxin-antitoxin module